jgi:hypothetical protein
MQFWEGTVDEAVASLMNSWRTMNPGYTYLRFNREMASIYLYDNYGEDSRVLQSFLASRIPAMASDIFRVAWLYKEGGIYVDAATEPLSPVDNWGICLHGKLVLMRKWHGKICNGFISSPSKSTVLYQILAAICDNIEKSSSSNIWEISGPGNFLFLDDSYPKDDLLVIEQSSLSSCFRLVNNLPHKEPGKHWSSQSNSDSIYRSTANKPPNIIVHLGPHKTASTSLQLLLESSEDALSSNKIGLLTVRSKKSCIYKHFRNAYTRSLHQYLDSGNSTKADFYALLEMTKALRGMLLLANDGYSQMIISDENLLGPQVGHYYAGTRFSGSLYPAATIVFTSLTIAFGQSLNSVFLVKREFSSWLLSVYKDYLTKGKDPIYPIAWRARVTKELVSEFDSLFNLARLIFGPRLVETDFNSFTEALAASNLDQMLGIQLHKSELSAAPQRLKYANASQALDTLYHSCFAGILGSDSQSAIKDVIRQNTPRYSGSAPEREFQDGLSLFLEEAVHALSS